MKILIAEDVPSNQKVLTHLLAPYGTCTIANDGEEALAAFTAALECGEPFELIFLDVIMPRMDGGAALQAIRDVERSVSFDDELCTKIICLTSLDDETELATFRADPGVSLMVKPVSTSTLAPIMERLGFKKL